MESEYLGFSEASIGFGGNARHDAAGTLMYLFEHRGGGALRGLASPVLGVVSMERRRPIPSRCPIRAARTVVWASLIAHLFLASGCGAPREGPPDIVLIVIDTLRADRVSSYGYPRPTTPNLDALALRGVRFANASSTSSWTIPAHASLFTGLLPARHRATQENIRLPDAPATLAEQLGARGYRTFAASANALVAPPTGLDRGFDGFGATWRNAAGDPRIHPNQRAVREFLDDLDPESPMFLYVNYMEVHGPYEPPEPFRSEFASGAPPPLDAHETAAYYLDSSGIPRGRFAELSDLYAGEVAYADALLGELLADLDDAGRLEHALVVVTSDHGENLGEHEHFRHVFNLYASAVRIPLVMALPGRERAGDVVDSAVSLVDVHATVLATAGVPPTAESPGRDLRAPIASDPIFAEYYYPHQALELFTPEERASHADVLAPYLRRLRSIERDGVRLIWSSNGEHELYDLNTDPGERRNLIGDPRYADRERDLHALLAEFIAREAAEWPTDPAAPSERKEAPLGDLDPEAAEHLRALGYLR